MAIPPPIALIALSPLTFQGVKLALEMKNRPTVDMNASTANLMTVVTTCTEPMFFTPDRLTAAGSHSPTSTSITVISLFWPLLMKCSTYSTQPTAIAAFPAHAVIQYDQAFPNATRAYAYGPPSAGNLRDSAANSIASASAPTVVSAIEISVIGPYDASEVGRLKMPTPMMLPMISAIACGRPNFGPSAPVVVCSDPVTSTLSAMAHSWPATVARHALHASSCLVPTFVIVSRPPGACRHPSGGDTGRRRARKALEQAQFHRALDGLRAGLHAELLVDRPQVGFHRVPRDVEGVRHLQVRAGRQQPQDAQLRGGQWRGRQVTWPVRGWLRDVRIE